ncbi:MAG: type II toxin-antitoxin system HicB family antitoxin [Deltaproteobacteria bacterium]|nr:type II toxin-antitoxin system HicB family antitoxin [Deltaproteobacteria bacterium]
MQSFTAVIERDEATGPLVGDVPGWPGAHSQGTTLDQLRLTTREVAVLLVGLDSVQLRLRGSHRRSRHPDARMTTVRFH